MIEKTIRWKILQCDAPEYLGLAKSQVHRMWQGGTIGFHKKLIVDGVEIELKSVKAPGCIIAYISIISGLSIFNRLYRRGSWALPYNFKLVDPATDSEKSAVPWTKVITPVGLDPLAYSLSFTARKDNLASTTGNLGTVGISNFTHAKIIDQLGTYVNMHSIGARSMFDLIVQRFRFFWGSYLFPAISTASMRVSEARDDGSFYFMYGLWDVARNPDLTPTAWTPATPRIEKFAGFVILSTDLLTLMKTSAKDNASGVILVDVSSKGRLIGNLIASDQVGNLTSVAVGDDYGREEVGFFPFSAYAGGAPGTQYTHVYRPDEVSGTIKNSWPYAMPQFARRGVQIDAFTQSWSYDFKIHTLGTDGSIVISDVPLPSVGNSTMTITGVSHGSNQAIGGYTMDVVFFDGENFVAVGQHTQTSTSVVVDPLGIDSTINVGSYTITSAFPQTQTGTDGFDSFTSYLPDIGVAFSNVSDGNGAPNAVKKSAFGAGYTFTTERDASFSWGLKPLLPSWGLGPSWGTYAMGGNPAVFTEHGFTGGRGDFGLFSPIFFAPPNGLGNVAIIPMKTEYLNVNGVFWYRRNGQHGYLIYQTPGTFAWRDDCVKYQNIVREQVGYRLIKNADGSTTPEFQYEDPDVVLTRIMSGVVIELNNFGTPELVAWTEGDGLWLVVER